MRHWILGWIFSSKWICRTFRDWQLRHSTSGPPFVHLPRPQSSQLFLIYGGMDAYVRGGSICSMGIFQFLQRSGLANRNVTWIRDPYMNNFSQGFGPDIPDLSSLEAWHRQHLASMPQVREVYTIGYSSGGYGAMLFGHLLGVKKVWAFSPRTSALEIKEDLDEKHALCDRLSDHNGITEYDIWYARRNSIDRAFSELLAACPHVTVHAHPSHGGTHFLMEKMIQSGEFQMLLPPAASESTVMTPGRPVD